MSSAKITLIGIENYLNPDHSVFEQMQLPVGIDRQILIDTILMRCQEFELLYSDPDFLINAVNVWSRKNYRVFDKWEKALNIEYDPLYNYDRHEEWDNTTTLNNKSEATTKKSSYDSSTLNPYDKVEGTDDNNGHEIRKGHLYGNIGVTTSQQMLESEFKVAEWNIYEYIKDLFMQTFCVMIY